MTEKPVRPWDIILSKERVLAEVKEARLTICKACPEFINLTSQCTKCRCFMKLKAGLPDAYCPLHKWEATTDHEKYKLKTID